MVRDFLPSSLTHQAQQTGGRAWRFSVCVVGAGRWNNVSSYRTLFRHGGTTYLPYRHITLAFKATRRAGAPMTETPKPRSAARCGRLHRLSHFPRRLPATATLLCMALRKASAAGGGTAHKHRWQRAGRSILPTSARAFARNASISTALADTPSGAGDEDGRTRRTSSSLIVASTYLLFFWRGAPAALVVRLGHQPARRQHNLYQRTLFAPAGTEGRA